MFVCLIDFVLIVCDCGEEVVGGGGVEEVVDGGSGGGFVFIVD